MKDLLNAGETILSKQYNSLKKEIAALKKEYSKGLASILWDMAQPNKDAITSFFSQLKEHPEILDKFRILDVYPVFRADKFHFKKKPTIVFRTEDVGTGKTASVHFIHMPEGTFDLEAFKNLGKNNPCPDTIMPLTDPIILGDTSELDSFRFSNDQHIAPIDQLSLCCGLLDGMIIHKNEKSPVWIYRDLDTILNATLVPVEHLNIWIKTNKDMDVDQICERIYATFGDSIPDFNIALYEDDPSKVKWWNTMEEAD